VALVIPDLMKMQWLTRIAAWRIALFFAIALGLFFGVNAGKVRDVMMPEFFRFFANFLALAFFTRSVADLRKLSTVLVLLSLSLALWTLGHGGHGPGLLDDENDVGLVLVTLLPFSFLRIQDEPDKKKAAFYLGAFLITLLGITATLSRGAMVGTLPTLFFIWLRSKRKVVSLALVFLLLGVAVVSAPDKLVSEFKTISDTKEATAASRTLFWGLSIDLFLARPFAGVGANSWGLAMWSGIIPIPGSLSNMTPHSVYFQVLSELGAVGVVAWVGFILAIWTTLRSLTPKRTKKDLAPLLDSRVVNPVFLKRFESGRAFLGSFATAQMIAVIGYLCSGAFLSVLFYAELFALSAFAQASRNAWQREIILAHAVGQKPGRPEAAGL
jgi:O-antigen ligase